jgi:hypothetical protein
MPPPQQLSGSEADASSSGPGWPKPVAVKNGFSSQAMQHQSADMADGANGQQRRNSVEWESSPGRSVTGHRGFHPNSDQMSQPDPDPKTSNLFANLKNKVTLITKKFRELRQNKY